jgi:hypothetical protein
VAEFLGGENSYESIYEIAPSNAQEMLVVLLVNPPNDSKSGNAGRNIMMDRGEKRTSWDLLW